MPETDPTLRFSNRVEDYIRWRPSYPAGLLGVLAEETGLTPAAVIADVGSGTGILSELFLRNGNQVLGVEPNAEMRAAGERLLRQYPRFHSVPGRAEATTLADASVDYVVAGQAFHWFDPTQAQAEFARVLRPGGWAVLVWNTRRVDSTPFLQEYEELLQRYGTDYARVRHENVDDQALGAFFAHGCQKRRLYNEQRFDFEGLKGRLLSCSYIPAPDQATYQPMLDELARIFDEHQVQGLVTFEYDTEAYFGRIGT
jgi:SAM-dependent methyltransferase